MKPFSASEKQKFDRIKKLTLDVIKAMDNQKMLNYKRYQAMFDYFEKDPDAFRKWEVLNSEELDSCPTILQLPFEEVRMPQIKKAADILGVPLEEYIWYRDIDPQGTRSKMKVPVGYVSIKRVQQILSKKNHYATDSEERSLKTGDVKSESKVASLSDVEAMCLAAIGADKALEELLGPRGDNTAKKKEMYRQIARDGYTSLETLPEDRTSQTTLNTINTYLTASGLRSDLINNSLKTEYTIKQDLRNRKS